MEKKKEVEGRSQKSKVMTVLLGVSLFCVLSFLLLAILDKGELLGGDNKPHQEPPKEEIKFSNWTDYLAFSNIVKAELYRKTSVEYGDEYDSEKTVELTAEQVKEIMADLKKYDLYKIWYEELSNSPSGLKLTITYEKNGREYTFVLDDGMIFPENLEETLKTIIEAKVNTSNLREENENKYFYTFDEDKPFNDLYKYIQE